VNRSAANSLPEEPWPLSARSLLSERENEFYHHLIALYPNHQIFVQVALSQLINVDRNHPECHSTRARYKQLVADFVLCGQDLRVIAVIELDDRSHERGDRQDADARKNKALADAGIRLVRIPTGRLPTEHDLRKLVNAEGTVEEGVQEETALSLVEQEETEDAAVIHVRAVDPTP
jgi:very-short-patch-repair endonuclease